MNTLTLVIAALMVFGLAGVWVGHRRFKARYDAMTEQEKDDLDTDGGLQC